jgi:hypothetical protein
MGDMESETVSTKYRTGSHSVRIGWQSGQMEVEKEEVFLYFETTWRGRPALVTLSADRYRHSEGMSEWRVYASDAKEHDPERNGGRGDDLTDLARRRLGELLVPVAKQWLAGLGYIQSRQTAFYHALDRMAREQSAFSRRDTEDLRKALATFGHELPPERQNQLFSAAARFDAFLEVLNDKH